MTEFAGLKHDIGLIKQQMPASKLNKHEPAMQDKLNDLKKSSMKYAQGGVDINKEYAGQTDNQLVLAQNNKLKDQEKHFDDILGVTREIKFAAQD